jgi:putative polyketide hydroxylase
MNQTNQQHEKVPVLIIGGGLVGLSTSLFLSHAGVSSLMVERHPGTAIHPRAMGFSPRTLEMFRAAGVEEAIRRIEPPLASVDGSTLLVESLVGQVFDNLQENVSSIFTGPVPGSAIAQDLLEPLLRARAEELGGDLRFGHELVACEQDAEGITATIRERESGHTYTVRAQFLVAADGSNSPLREQFGIGQHGEYGLFYSVSIIFEAELMKIFHEQHAIMCFLANDTVSGAMVPYPGSFARPDLFRLDVTYDPEEETLDDYPEERCLALIRAAVGIPDLPITRMRAVLTYEANALVADSF